jgi:hypothetical protein
MRIFPEDVPRSTAIWVPLYLFGIMVAEILFARDFLEAGNEDLAGWIMTSMVFLTLLADDPIREFWYRRGVSEEMARRHRAEERLEEIILSRLKSRDA